MIFNGFMSLTTHVGTTVTLQSHAVEFVIPGEAFLTWKIGGMCMPRSRVEGIFNEMRSTCGKRSQRKLNTIENKIKSLPESIFLVIVISDRPHNASYSFLTNFAVRMSLINHERFHAITMCKPKEWHDLADSVLTTQIGERWTVVKDAILSSKTYSNKELTKEASGSWIATTEILARIATIIHAAPKHRKAVARYQLRSNPDDLISLSNMVQEHWLLAESIIGWIDAQYY
jgi:hypothetical protein